MAEEFHPSNWWKTSKSSGSSGGSGFDGGSPATSTISFSTAITDVTGAPLPWASGSGRPLMDSTLQLSGFSVSPPSTDWSQTLLASSSGRAESSFHALLQDDLSSRPAFSPAIDAGESSSVQLRDMNNPFFFENSIHPGVSFPHASPPPPSSMIHVLFDPDSRTEQSLFDAQQMVNYQQSHMIHQKQQSAMINQLQFANNTPYWNASASSQPFDLIMKSSEGGREKRSSSEPAMKKVRAEQASPLPTFKVRKEKLGDRITALQQLVSPFGKTDTASVLHEAIVYIKFLHDQVSILSNPYLKNAHPMQHHEQQSTEKSMDDEGEEQSQNLRSRGLCLVPISITYPVASETTADFWTPSFGETFR